MNDAVARTIADHLIVVSQNVETLKGVERRYVDLWWGAVLLGDRRLADVLWEQIATMGRVIRPISPENRQTLAEWLEDLRKRATVTG